MAFTPITEAEIKTGEPVSAETQAKIKENFDSLDQRMTTLEGGGSTVYPPIIMRVNGPYGEPGDLQIPADGILKTTPNFNLTVTGARLLIDKAGVSGTTEIDIKYKRGGGAWTSIFTAKPSVASVAGDDATSTNAELNPSHVNLQAGDLIRLDIVSAQKRAVGMLVRLDYIKT